MSRVVDKVRSNVDRTMRVMARNARALPFPEPWWIHDPQAITGILKENYPEDIRGMIDVYRVGQEEVGMHLCVDAAGKGQLLLGKECRGKGSYVVVKDCKPTGISVGTIHSHPGNQPCLSPQDLDTQLVSSFFSCLGWKSEGRYMLKAVILDTYYFQGREFQNTIDNMINDVLFMEEQLGALATQYVFVDGQSGMMYAEKYLQQIVLLCTHIENLLGSYTCTIS